MFSKELHSHAESTARKMVGCIFFFNYNEPPIIFFFIFIFFKKHTLHPTEGGSIYKTWVRYSPSQNFIIYFCTNIISDQVTFN